MRRQLRHLSVVTAFSRRRYRALVFGCLVVLAFLGTGHTLVAAEILNQLRLERQNNRKAEINVTHLVALHIPVGTTVDAAREILEKNGFKIYRRDLPDGSYRLSGTITEKSADPFANNEYRIVLTIARGQVAAMFARIFLHTL